MTLKSRAWGASNAQPTPPVAVATAGGQGLTTRGLSRAAGACRSGRRGRSGPQEGGPVPPGGLLQASSGLRSLLDITSSFTEATAGSKPPNPIAEHTANCQGRGRQPPRWMPKASAGSHSPGERARRTIPQGRAKKRGDSTTTNDTNKSPRTLLSHGPVLQAKGRPAIHGSTRATGQGWNRTARSGGAEAEAPAPGQSRAATGQQRLGAGLASEPFPATAQAVCPAPASICPSQRSPQDRGAMSTTRRLRPPVD